MCGFNYPNADLLLSVTCAYPALALGFACLVVAAVGSRWMNRRVPGCALVASLAYSLYLTHKSVAFVAHRWMHRQDDTPTWSALAESRPMPPTSFAAPATRPVSVAYASSVI